MAYGSWRHRLMVHDAIGLWFTTPLAYGSWRHWLMVHDAIGLWFMTLLGMTFVPCFCSPLPSRMHVYRKLFDSVVWVPPMEEAVSCDAYALGVTWQSFVGPALGMPLQPFSPMHWKISLWPQMIENLRCLKSSVVSLKINVVTSDGCLDLCCDCSVGDLFTAAKQHVKFRTNKYLTN